MRLKEDNTKQKLRGAYYTPYPLAKKMIELFEGEPGMERILEPSCGDGVFIDGVIDTESFRNTKVTAIELDKKEASCLKKRLKDQKNIKILNQDFFDYYRSYYKKEKYDLILGNPPYIRYQYLEEHQRETMSGILMAHGMKANKLVNAWVGFLVASIQMLGPKGKIAFVIPAEILQVAYAEDLRFYLSDNLSKITLITFEELVFPDIEQEILVFIGEKGGEQEGIRIIELMDLKDLKNLDLGSVEFQKLQHVHEKWTKYFTNADENRMISRIRKDERFQKMSDTALINVGITTGNNKYFSVGHDTVEKYGFEHIVRPLIGRSSHASGIYFTREDWEKNISNAKAAYLLDFPDIPFKDYPREHKKYIRAGEESGENKGYKCSIRERWYRIPSIWVPDGFFLRRNNRYPKFVLNDCDAVSTDTMHRIKFYEGVEPERILLSYYNSISFAFTEICGRSYGGGVLEILPGEVGNIILPKLTSVPMELVHDLLLQVDRIVREQEDIEKALDMVDSKVLVPYLGIEEETLHMARRIWKKMQKRRLKRG